MRVGFIGFGSIAEQGHLPALASFEGVEVVAVADVSGARLEQANALLPGITLYESGADLLENEPLDLVDICATPSSHCELMVRSCRQGIPDIVCEKPFVLTEAEYLEVMVERESSGARIVSVNNWMYSDLYRHVASALPLIGPIESVELRTERMKAALGHGEWIPNWRVDPAHGGGGILLDHGWHQLYLILNWIGSPLQTVAARTRTADPRHHPVEDEAVVDLHFAGETARIDLKWTGSERRNEGVIKGERGTIWVHDDRIVVENGRRQEMLFSGRLTQSSYHPDWFRSMFQSTIFAPDRGEADHSFDEAGVLVKAVAAAYRSAREGGAPIPVGAGSAVPVRSAAHPNP